MIEGKISFCIRDLDSRSAGAPLEVATLAYRTEDGLVRLALGEHGFRVWQWELDKEFRTMPITIVVTVMGAGGGEVQHDLAKALAWLDRMEKVCADSGNGLIHVGGAGSGSTEKSRKVRLLARAKPKGETSLQQVPAAEHTLTVPASSIEEHGGRLWMPRWAARKSANERLPQPGRQVVVYAVEGLDGQCMVPPDVHGGIEGVRRALRGGLERVLSVARASAQEAWARHVASQAALQAEAPARMEAARKAAEVQAEQTRKAAEAAARAKANRENLPAITGASVAWVDYVGTSRNKKAVLSEADECTVRYSGERVYITTPDGADLVKTRQTVQVNNEELPAQHSVRRARKRR